MRRMRGAALLAAILLALLAGLGASQAVVGRPMAAASSDVRSGSISALSDVSGLLLTAVEPGRAVILVRLEARHASSVLATAVLAVALLVAAAIGRRGPISRRVLELTIRSRTEWWRPTPGGRAPPEARTL